MSTLHALALLAAEEGPDPDKVRPGPIAFALFVLFAVATVLLWRSMNKHLRRVPPTFEGDQAPGHDDTGPAVDPPSATGAPDEPGDPPGR